MRFLENIDKDYKTRFKIMLFPMILFQAIIFYSVYIFPKSQSYHLTQFIFVSSWTSYLVLMFALIWSVWLSNHLTKPENRISYLVLKDRISQRKADEIEQLFVASFTEEIICRYQLFYLTGFLINWLLPLAPELLIALLFLLISSLLFSLLHDPRSKVVFTYYFVSGIFLGSIFLLCGLVGVILVHLAYNLSSFYTENHYYLNPPKF